MDPAKTGFLGGLGLPVLFSWIVGGLFAAGLAYIIGKVALGFSVFTDYDEYQKIQTPLKGSSKLYDTFWQLKTD